MDKIKHSRWLGYVDNLTICVFLVTLILCVHYCVYSAVHSGGVFIGILTGVLLSGFYLLYLRHSASKKRFLMRAYMGNGKSIKVLLITCVLIGLIVGFLYGELKDRYPAIQIKDAVVAGMTFGFVVFFGLDLAGIYWLQRCYGYRFYIAKTEQEAEEVASRYDLGGSKVHERCNDSGL